MNATTGQGTLSNAPLELLFPNAAAAEIDRVRAAASSLDQARPPADPAQWWWHPTHATFPGTDAAGTPVIGDWTQLDLDVSWTPKGLHEVTAQLGIACHCATDHGTHYIYQLGTPADSTSTLASAFEAAAQTLIGWIAGPSDPDHWRTAAGLPSSVQ